MIRLLVARKKMGLSQIELAERAGTTNVQISRIENGNVMPKSDLLKKLSEILNVSMDYLMDESDDETMKN